MFHFGESLSSIGIQITGNFVWFGFPLVFVIKVNGCLGKKLKEQSIRVGNEWILCWILESGRHLSLTFPSVWHSRQTNIFPPILFFPVEKTPLCTGWKWLPCLVRCCIRERVQTWDFVFTMMTWKHVTAHSIVSWVSLPSKYSNLHMFLIILPQMHSIFPEVIAEHTSVQSLFTTWHFLLSGKFSIGVSN